MAYRVVYGETMPAWERIFPTRREARAFVKERKSVGDIVFGTAKKVIPGEPSKSVMAAIERGNN